MKTFSLYRSSAGSGKTRTLAKVWLKLALASKVDYFQHILAVTFTNKASQEMKDRILEYLNDFANGKTTALAGELQRELNIDSQTFQQRSQDILSAILHRYDSFSISTIDAFFQKVIRSFTQEAGLVGDYRLEVDQDTVLEEVIDNLIDELGDNRQLTEWVVDFARENLENERAWDVRYSLIDFGREIFREEFRAIEDEVTRVASRPNYFRELRDDLWRTRNSFLQAVSKPAIELLDIIRSNGWDTPDFSYGSRAGLLSFLNQVVRARDMGKYPSPGKLVRTHFIIGENWPAKKSQHARDILAIADTELAPRLVAILEQYDATYHQARSADVVLRNMYVFGLITDTARKLKEYKDENNIMLLADAPKLLNGVIHDSDTPFIYEKVGSFYRNYLIDEFQDTSGLQWQNFFPLIVNSLDQGYPSLVVGDVKQAIYRWRGGDLSLLQEKIADLIGPERVELSELTNNFRSAPAIVDFNNRLFKTAATLLPSDNGVTSASLAYRDVVQTASRDDVGFVEVQFMTDDDPDVGEVRSWREKAMDNIPRVLERLQEAGASLREIAILVRRNDEGYRIAAHLMQYKRSADAKPDCNYEVVSNESLRIDGAASVNLLLGAMRYLLNPNDAIARAQLAFEYARIHEPERALAEVFAITNQNIFENNLPPAFVKEKGSLKKLPLIELTETLVRIFELGIRTGELVYIQTFQDLVLEFGNREKNDLGAFLEWWEVNKEKKSVQLSGDVDAAQILTVHKAKGLQFKYVIIPFCSWSLDHDGRQGPNLWVRSDEPPFRDAGFLPVRYTKALEETFFGGYYVEERAKIALDNLNLLYVALTRAESGLIVSAPSPGLRGPGNTIAGLMYDSIEMDEVLRPALDPSTQIWRSGEWKIQPMERRIDTTSVQLTEYLSSPWREKLVIRRSASDWFREKADYGIYTHAVLSRMRYSDQLNEVLTQLANEGLIGAGEIEELSSQLSDVLSNPKVSGWFSREWKVLTEVPILLPEGTENRIDRLLLKDRKAIVIDFKTGSRKKADERQVQDYMNVLHRMNFTDVEGYLLYIAENAIEEVATGAGFRLNQKRKKNTDQLELGL